MPVSPDAALATRATCFPSGAHIGATPARTCIARKVGTTTALAAIRPVASASGNAAVARSSPAPLSRLSLSRASTRAGRADRGRHRRAGDFRIAIERPHRRPGPDGSYWCGGATIRAPILATSAAQIGQRESCAVPCCSGRRAGRKAGLGAMGAAAPLIASRVTVPVAQIQRRA